jgi:hypothetical protein
LERIRVAASGPSITDYKRLFARSGNRCAFPKCPASIVHEDTLLGEVAHIKGLNVGSARHDRTQTPEERNAYSNLILLCPNHHTIIDDDEVSYTEERLHSIKTAHEALATPVSPEETDRDIRLFINQPVTIVGASGVVTGVVHSQQVVLPPTADTAMQARRVLAIETLWKSTQRFGDAFSDVVFIDTILVPKEINDYFRSGLRGEMFAGLQAYASLQTTPDKFTKANQNSVDERPFISPKAWGILHVLKTLYGRSAMLIQLSFKKRAYQCWKDDQPLDHLLRAVLPGHIVDEAKKREIGGLRFLIEHLEIDFMTAANT